MNRTNSNRAYISRENIDTLPDESGVYFLFQSGNILVYIGRAKSIRRRIADHDSYKVFISVGYELTHFSRARDREKQLIAQYYEEHGHQLPFYNRQH